MRRSDGRDPWHHIVVTFRMHISGGYARARALTHAGRFDRRKAVMPFRVDKWQSPTQPSRADFARSRCSLIHGSHVRHRIL